jgi:hypothetical protein
VNQIHKSRNWKHGSHFLTNSLILVLANIGLSLDPTLAIVAISFLISSVRILSMS